MYTRLIACFCILAALLPCLEGGRTEIAMHLSAEPRDHHTRANFCPYRNTKLISYINNARAQDRNKFLPHSARNLDEFALEVKTALEEKTLPERPIHYLFSEASPFKPTCDGLWAEFGVFSGDTVNLAARSRAEKCGPACPSVHGFDTFTGFDRLLQEVLNNRLTRSWDLVNYLPVGLPEAWVAAPQMTWHQGYFEREDLPVVETNVNLVKGLFNESIPPFLQSLNHFAGSTVPLSYLHVDCDLYNGSRDILTLLGPRLVVGTVILFDELVNYEFYKQHEIKAMWEWLHSSGAKVYPIGMYGPLPKKGFNMQLDFTKKDEFWDFPHEHQSAAFVVVEMPSATASSL